MSKEILERIEALEKALKGIPDCLEKHKERETFKQLTNRLEETIFGLNILESHLEIMQKQMDYYAKKRDEIIEIMRVSQI